MSETPIPITRVALHAGHWEFLEDLARNAAGVVGVPHRVPLSVGHDMADGVMVEVRQQLEQWAEQQADEGPSTL